MLEDVKKSLRVTTNHFDEEIEDLISAAKEDLQYSGGINIDNKDIRPLIKRAIITYCKAYFGYDNPEADRFQESYIMIKQHLALFGDYDETS